MMHPETCNFKDDLFAIISLSDLLRIDCDRAVIEIIGSFSLVKIRAQLPARRAYSPEGGPGFGPPRRGDYIYQQCIGVRLK